MSRNNGAKPDPNAPRPPGAGMGAGTQLLDPAAEAEADYSRQEITDFDKALDNDLPLSEADAQRIVPRPRTDNLDERFARRIPADNAARTRPSSRLKKRLSKQKNDTLRKQPASRRKVLEAFTGDSAQAHQRFEIVNRALADAQGNINELGPAAQTGIRRLDRFIADYERNNVGVATVYTPVSPPSGMSNDELAARFQALAANNGTMTFDRYLVADHSIHEAVTATQSNKASGPPLVFEYETSRGAYLGRSDSVPQSTHLLARGNRVDVLGVKTVTVQNPDGSTFTQRVVQLRDHFDPDVRTTAKS